MMVAEDFDDRHRLFLQHMMSKTIVKGAELKALYSKCQPEQDDVIEPSPEEMAEFVKVVNLNIRDLNMEIKKGADELSGTMFYCLASTGKSSVLKTCTDMSNVELEIFKLVLEKIAVSEQGRLTIGECLDLHDALGDKKLSMSETQTIMNKLVSNRWLEENKNDGTICLHVRATIELEGYIKELAPDIIKDCKACKKMLIQGLRCLACEEPAYHRHCYEKMKKANQVLKCVQCHNQLNFVVASPQPSQNGGTNGVAHDSDSDDGDRRARPGPRSGRPGPNSQPSGRRNKPTRQAIVLDSDSD